LNCPRANGATGTTNECNGVRDVAGRCARPSGIGSSAPCQAAWYVLQGGERFSSDTLLFSSHGNALSVYLHHLDADVGFDDWAAMQKPDLFRIEEGAWERVDLNTVDV